ncbi:MAG TPA: tripartite tricarboxylate transporter TctB family protein [Ramlibacter sp.]|uniref:tripartite tricarboxylate transporter TctB family protein n=1 Tax=Ramlibacter sp. TaxID=1917967 RepID=UPI002D804B9A|nr:tripartite tricarboxylate transporter TctB family protein [Ramlibacter sp.]HET8744901.1 tripartite tricarboxylate transporter TctB family protein [Ramlibacter sp.]
MKVQRGDFALGLAAVVLAAAWLRLADGIPDSLLSDAVGAAGLPRAVGWTLAGVGTLLCARSVLRAPSAQGEGASAGWRAHLRALGLLAILFGYLLLAPWLGYAAATAALLAAGAAYAGAPRGRMLVIVPVLGALVFWLLFVHAFGIPMPGSVLLGGA